jgi:hypothetical protein
VGVRFVLVEGATGEGATVHHDSLDIATTRNTAASGSHALLNGLGKRVIAAARNGRLRSIGVTWSDWAAADGSSILRALAASGVENVIAVSQSDTADALATGIKNLSGYDDIAVCIVEPDAAVVAIVNTKGVLVDRIDRPVDGGDVDDLVEGLLRMMHLRHWKPESIFILGSADDLDLIRSSLEDATPAPVVSAAEADLALARGAALAVRAMYCVEAPVASTAAPGEDAPASAGSPRPRLTSRVGVLTAVLAAAVVTFIVSLSVALGMRLLPDSEEAPVAATGGPLIAGNAPAGAQPAPQSLPAAPPPEAPPPEAPPPAEESVVVTAVPASVAAPAAAAPVAPPTAEEMTEPLPAAPPPGYIPPQTPAYVPPPPDPRLRDRVIERIPILNRFHQPQR